MQQLPILERPAAERLGRPNAHPAVRTKGRYCLVSLGCPKNLVDSERMAGLLDLDGYQLVREPQEADFAVINTCGFISAAREESLGAIAEMAQLKRQGQLRGLIVAGCLVQRDKESLLERFPEIDQLVGVFARDQIAQAADRFVGNLAEQRSLFRPAPSRPLSDSHRLRLTPRHMAFLKIAEGCNQLCTFCTIPKMRGRLSSKPLDEVLAEAEELAADGVRELVVVAQDTSSYGIDDGGSPRLAELLARLDRIEGLDWIRLMYVYPLNVTDELIGTIASARRIVPYLDLPLQHANDEVLRRMCRRVTRAQTEQLLQRLRDGIPGLVLRTTLIAGFPGETRQQFQDAVAFVRAWRFERLGAFAFSPEPGTPAVKLDGQLPEEVRTQLRDRLLAVQQEIALAWNTAQIGRRLDVLLDHAVPEQPAAFVGRSYADAPEVDGAVYVTGAGLQPGHIVPCEIVATRGYDLIAAAVDSPR